MLHNGQTFEVQSLHTLLCVRIDNKLNVSPSVAVDLVVGARLGRAVLGAAVGKSEGIGERGYVGSSDVGVTVRRWVGGTVSVDELSSDLFVGAKVGNAVGESVNLHRHLSDSEHGPVFVPSTFIFKLPPSK